MDDRLRIKVTDIALSRDLFPDDYHCLGDSENRPIKWMALESFTHKEYSTASDVVINLISIHEMIYVAIVLLSLIVVFWCSFVGVDHISSAAVR